MITNCSTLISCRVIPSIPVRVRRNVIASVKGPVHPNFCLIVLAMKRPTDPSLPLKVILVLTRLGQRVLSVVQLGCFSRVLVGSLVAFTIHGNNQNLRLSIVIPIYPQEANSAKRAKARRDQIIRVYPEQRVWS